MALTTTTTTTNPYVGPRTFSSQESDQFFGRNREARELFSLVISERLVLFFAQSGAGKSSLLQARLIPQLLEADYAVLPTGRVSGQLPAEIGQVKNIYIFNLLLSLAQGGADPNQLADLDLSTFLARLSSDDGKHYYYDAEIEDQAAEEAGAYEETPYILIIDQFEEIVTSHAERWSDRNDFFRQLDRAMSADPNLWVVLTLREDHLAALEPYADLVTDKFRAQFYMERMDHRAALQAIEQPARPGGKTFRFGRSASTG